MYEVRFTGGIKMKKFSLRKKLTLLIILLSGTLGCSVILFGYQTYKNSIKDHYILLGTNLARTVSTLINGDKLEYYLETLSTDQEYDETLALMRILQTENEIMYLYVVKPVKEGTYYIYDTDESEDRCELGYFEEWYSGDFENTSQRFLAGEEIAPLISKESFGWLLSVYAPIHGSNGGVVGYVGADFDMSSVVRDRQQFLFLLILITTVITVLFGVAYYYIISKIIISPINKMVKAVDASFVGQQPADSNQHNSISEFAKLDINFNDEIGTLASAMQHMEQKMNEYIQNLDVVTRKAETDDLTGLYNREAFQMRVSSYLQRMEGDSQRHAFIMIDVDRFKKINDTYGHVIGDEVLEACADALRKVFRSSDEVVRMGGDEFAVFCKCVGDIQQVEEKAKGLCAAWRQIRISGLENCRMSVSVGISIAPCDGTTYQELYQKADAALYEAKSRGRDQYVIFGRT